MDTLLDFSFTILQTIASFNNFLITPLPYINMSPLGLLTLGGITTIIVIHVVRLFI